MARRKPESEPTPTPTVDERPAAAETLTPVAVTDPVANTMPAGDASPAGTPSTGVSKPFPTRADYAAGVTLREDKRYRQVQLQFRDKPTDAVRTLVREAGFTWQPTDRVWVKPIDRDAGWKARLDGERLFQEVVAEIAREQGQTQGR